MPSTSSIQHSRDAPGQGNLKRRVIHRTEAAAVANPRAGTPEGAAADREGTPDGAGANQQVATPEGPVAPQSVDDIDADDPSGAIPELAAAAAAADDDDDSSDSDSEEGLREELERARLRSKQAEERRKRSAATASAAAKRYDADVLFRYDANPNGGAAGGNKAPFNDPTANEFHAKFLKRFFK